MCVNLEEPEGQVNIRFRLQQGREVRRVRHLDEFHEAIGTLRKVSADGGSLRITLARYSDVDFQIEFNVDRECKRARDSLASLIGKDVGILVTNQASSPLRIRIMKKVKNVAQC